jgi:glucose/arabinose dehydrogenase/mono/diheme cytochrome c family protein
MPNRLRVRSIALFLSALLTAGSSLAQSGDRNGDEQRPPPAHLKSPPAPALSAEEALQRFRVAPGFRVEIVASDPLVLDPVAMTIGADGRIWVAEMRAYMPNVEGKGEDAPIGTIAVLEDTDMDGRMDRRTEFAGGFVLPRALALIDDGVLVAEPPNLWFLKDTNGDGKADVRTKVADDYGNPSSPEHTANGLMWALDNWIYSANHTVRFRYDAGEWRREPTIFRGQWGITQDDYGRLFYNSNSDPLRMDVVPAEYLKRNPNLVEPLGANVQLVKPQDLSVWPSRVTIGVNRGYRILREDGTLPEVTAACGPVIYRGSLFPPSFRGNAFIAEPAGNLVKRVLVEERDGVPSARNAYERTEFLTSTDERFRPVNLYNGPDGSLYIVDMYRGIIQHRIYITTYLRNQIQERGLQAPVGMGRIYRVVPEGKLSRRASPSLAKMKSVKLVAELEHEDAWRRDTAQRLLVERRDTAALSALRKLLQTASSSLARLHALWTLDGMKSLDWSSVERALQDPDVQVALAGARVAEPFLKQDSQRTLAALHARAQWGELPYQRQLALTLGAAPQGAGDELLMELARGVGARPYMADAIASSLRGRELEFFEHLAQADDASAMSAELTPVLASLSAAVLQAGNATQMEQLLAYMNEGGPQNAWLSNALLDGVERFIPGEPPKQRTAFLPSEPKALIEFSAGTSDQAARARAALEFIRWKGQKIDTGKALASLTPEEQQRFEKGREAFATCAACHQPNGEGMPGLAPPLVGSRWVTGGTGALTRIVLNGKTSGEMTMPPLRSLDDDTIAAILTYIRRSWGHQSDPVSPAQVKWDRGQTEDREEPWSEGELEPMN